MNNSSQTTEDFRLVNAFKAGDRRAFEELVRKYQRQVANIVYLTLGSREDVQDIAQEVFIRVYRSIDKFEFDASFFSWIYRITVNLCIDELRRRKIKRALSLDFLTEGTLEKEKKSKTQVLASDGVLDDEKREIILAALQKMSHEHRQVMILREYEELSYAEIASYLGISVQAVKSRIFRAREDLRALLKDYFEERT
ncbi:MAG TPA: sigma-70 family RNA polymerase sigma factor [Bacteroidota bacterium]